MNADGVRDKDGVTRNGRRVRSVRRQRAQECALEAFDTGNGVTRNWRRVRSVSRQRAQEYALEAFDTRTV